MEFASSALSGAKNFEVVLRFFWKFCAPLISSTSVIQSLALYYLIISVYCLEVLKFLIMNNGLL